MHHVIDIQSHWAKTSLKGGKDHEPIHLPFDCDSKRSKMENWQSRSLEINNLHIVVKDKLIITDDADRYISLPKQMFWEFMQELEDITESFKIYRMENLLIFHNI